MRQNTITADEMKAIDKNAADLGMSPLQLMENAGSAVAEIVSSILKRHAANHSGSSSGSSSSGSSSFSASVSSSPASSVAPSVTPSVLFFAGLGNNGGDTFVAARRLADLNISSVVFLLGRKREIKTPEALLNFQLIKQTPFISFFEIQSESCLKTTYSIYGKTADIIVDGIFGTGFSGEPKGLEKAAIELINFEKTARSFPVLSIDIPSGMPPAGFADASLTDSGLVVKADATVTFHKMKTFLETQVAQNCAGDIFVRPIGIPKNAEKYAGPGDLSLLYKRTADSKKGDSGKVLVIAGGQYTGAPALAGMGALRAGCDIVTIAAPRSIYKEVASFAPEFIVRKLSGDLLSENDLPILIELIQSHDSVVIGPGFGSSPESLRAAAQLVPYFKKAVIDADALRTEFFEAVLKNTSAEIIITPHYHEFVRTAAYFNKILPSKRRDIKPKELEAVVFEIAQKLGAVVLLKGREDLIASVEEIRCNSTGNAGMSVGGTGDVLAGVTGGLLAVNSAALAACCAAYVCGKAGEATYEKVGDSLLPTDLLKKVPSVLGAKKNRKRKK